MFSNLQPKGEKMCEKNCGSCCGSCDSEEELALEVSDFLRRIDPDDLDGENEGLELLQKAVLCAIDEDDNEALAYVRDILETQEESGEDLEDILTGKSKRLWFEIMELLD